MTQREEWVTGEWEEDERRAEEAAEARRQADTKRMEEAAAAAARCAAPRCQSAAGSSKSKGKISKGKGKQRVVVEVGTGGKGREALPVKMGEPLPENEQCLRCALKSEYSLSVTACFTEVPVDAACCPKSGGNSCASCHYSKVKCKWPRKSRMAEVWCESLKVMRDMTCTLDQLAMVMEKSQLNLADSEDSSGKMKPSVGDEDEFEFEERGEEESSESSGESDKGDDEEAVAGPRCGKRRELKYVIEVRFVYWGVGGLGDRE